ncbi:MAG: DNA primase [bacterium]
MQIPENVINEIRDRADIVEVVSRFVELRRAGSNYKGLCPFHEEKTPSFNVNPDRQIFHCFGCGRGGNVYTFLMEIEGISFPEAVRSLGRQYGVEVASREVPAEIKSRNEALYRANEFACQLFERNLMNRRTGERARDYLLRRKIPQEMWTDFRLGYAADAWDLLVRAARKKGYSLDTLRDLKLIVTSDKSKGYYDYFRSRIMFPIASLSRRVVAFGARTLEKDAEPKYLNSAESPVYQKRRTLFGLDRAREVIRERRAACLVEGYTDCIAMHANGFGNTVASCGTAITSDHASLLRRFTQTIILIPDADVAGLDSALSAGAVFLAAGFDVRVAKLDPGMDPDTAVNALGTKKFEKNLRGALDYLQFLDYIMKSRPMSPREKESVIHRVTGGLADFGDRLRYEVVLHDIAGILGVDADALRARRRPEPAKGGRPEAGGRKERPSPDEARRAKLEKTLLRLLLANTPEAAEAREKLDSDDFSQGRCREFYKLLDSSWENHIDIQSHEFHQRAEGAGLEGFAAEIALIQIPPGQLDRLLNDTLRRVKELRIRDELNVLKEKLQDLPEDSDEAVGVAEQYARLKRALSEL